MATRKQAEEALREYRETFNHGEECGCVSCMIAGVVRRALGELSVQCTAGGDPVGDLHIADPFDPEEAPADEQPTA